VQERSEDSLKFQVSGFKLIAMKSAPPARADGLKRQD
jgi:hypothetical protein